MKKVIKGCGMFLLVFIFVSVFLMILSSKFSFSILGYRFFKVVSGSMQPSIAIGDFIIVKEQKDYDENDIVTYMSDNYYVTHRIVEENENTIITKGDYNNTNDEPISKEQIVGKMILKIGGLNDILGILTQPFSLILISVFGIAVCFYVMK